MNDQLSFQPSCTNNCLIALYQQQSGTEDSAFDQVIEHETGSQFKGLKNRVGLIIWQLQSPDGRESETKFIRISKVLSTLNDLNPYKKGSSINLTANKSGPPYDPIAHQPGSNCLKLYYRHRKYDLIRTHLSMVL